MKKVLAFSLALILIFGAVFAIRLKQTPEYCEKTSFALNTVIKISAYGKDASKAADAALKEIHRIDSLMNAHSTSSEIYRINSSSDGAVVSKEVFNKLYSSVAFTIQLFISSCVAFSFNLSRLIFKTPFMCIIRININV